MSGDVQPRKRKDKKKRKDDLGIEEPRGTAAVLGEGDVFIHTYHEHGTGGHWCAKIIFFSLLAVLVTLIGLIILENRGLSELEANAVESRYSGVLEGWIEDIPEDDHHDEHTLELKHPDEEISEDDHEHESENDEHDEDDGHDEGQDDEDEEEDHDDDEEEGHEDDEEENHEDDEEDEENENYDDQDEEVGLENNIDESEENQEINEDEPEHDNQSDDEDNADIAYSAYKKYYAGDDSREDLNKQSEEVDNNNEESDDENDEEDYDNDQNTEKNYSNDIDENDDENENDATEVDDNEWRDKEEDHTENEDDDDDNSEEVEKIEREISDEEILSSEQPTPEVEENEGNDGDDSEENEDAADKNLIEDNEDEPRVERITIPPAGKPYTEIEEETVQKTPDTLAEEEEYEKQQEELRRQREAQSSQGMWLKLVVGGALLVATHAVVRRVTAPRDEPDTEEQINNQEPSVTDRRMTLIPQTQENPIATKQISTPPTIQKEIIEKATSVIQTAAAAKPVPEDDKIQNVKNETEEKQFKDKDEEKELYSDEDEEEEEDEEEIDEDEEVKEEVIFKKPEVKDSKSVPATKPVEEPPEEDEDVEIIDEEQIEEELEDEEDEVEEEISDVDDTELLSRLEAKYGRLPEPERPGKNKDGGNNIEEDWPGEPSDPYWSQQLDLAEEELRQGAWSACERRASVPQLRQSARAQWLAAKSLDLMAEAKRDNTLLSRAVTAYLQLLKMNERLPDQKLIDVAQRAIDRIQFRGTYLNAEPIYKLLIRRFPDNVHYRNNLTVCFLMANRADLADGILQETLRIWPNDRIALAHYGFVLKNQYNKLDEAVIYLQKALEGDAGAANEPRFYYHLGDALLQLGRFEEAHEIHKRGAALGHFLSPSQRSLYNVRRLKGRPWWPVEDTPYAKLAQALQKSWREILKEGLAAKALYEKEKEGLKERGEWSQLDLFVRGREVPGRCQRAPVTCSIVREESAASACRRGQIKFSAIEPGTHVRPHVGPTNCRLRMHLGLSNTKDTFIRVNNETRQWEVGKVFIFDDSFEHEVWHNGTGSRLVLIVDVWHPQLTPAERRTLPAI